MDNNNSSRDVQQGQSKALNSAKDGINLGKNINNAVKNNEALKKAAETGLNGIKEILLGGLSSETMMVIGIILLIIAIPLLLITIFPIGNIFQDNRVISNTEASLESVVTRAYNNEKQSSKHQIVQYVNSNYACKAELSDMTSSGSGYVIDTDYCLINVDYGPDLSEMTRNISAYVNAVNGTIAFYGEETDEELKQFENGTHEPIEKYDGQILETKPDGSIGMTDGAKEFYDNNSSELTNTANENYIETLKVYSNEFFVYDNNTDRWKFNNFRIKPKKHQEYQKVGTEIVQTSNGMQKEVDLYDWVDVWVDAYYGDISILMFYDLSGYKAEDLEKCIDVLDSRNENRQVFADSTSVVSATLNGYYDSYIAQTNSYFDANGNVVLGKDNRNKLFQALLDDGTLMYVPISGLTSNFLEGEPGYSGGIGLDIFDGMSSSAIWREIRNMRSSGVIGYGTAMYNCTAFAQAWFYKVYGVNALYGDGKNMVNNLLDSNNVLCGDWGSTHFYRGSSPAPGGIFSISSPSGGNHVGCIDAVDYENKTITFSDGNTNGAGNSTATISIKRTLTFDEFESYVRGACAIYGNSSGATVTFANPIKD